MISARVFALNVHATWKCRHSGACCRAGWTIPVEAHARAITKTAWLEPDAHGACPQFDPASSLCRIHRDHGESLLPDSCRHFPRRALIDARGTFISLSNFCPTAAAMLVDGDELSIVDTPPAYPAERGYEGLDARGEWPPLLRRNALFDVDSFSLWEHYVVRSLGSSADDVETTLAFIADAAERLREWSADRGALVEWTAASLQRRADGTDALRRYAAFGGAEAFVRVCDTVPAGLAKPAQPAPLTSGERAAFTRDWQRQSRAALRYLGARAFASWTAYQAAGIRTQVAELIATAAVLRTECMRKWTRSGHTLDRAALIEAIRASDWLLVHLADRSALMTWLGEAER